MQTFRPPTPAPHVLSSAAMPVTVTWAPEDLTLGNTASFLAHLGSVRGLLVNQHVPEGHWHSVPQFTKIKDTISSALSLTVEPIEREPFQRHHPHCWP